MSLRRRLFARFTFLTASLAVTALLRAVEFPGTWSNGLDEFKTVSLMLRADGQAVFATAVLPGFALWEKTDTGLLLTLGGKGQSVRVPLTYDEASGTLRGRLRDTEIELRKVSDQEPPDMIAQAKEREAEQQARWKKMTRMEEVRLADRAALRALLAAWLAETDPAKRAESLFLAASDGQGQLTVRGLGDTRFLEVALESRRIAKPSGLPLESELLPGDSVSDLPLSYELAADKREALAKLAVAPGVTSTVNAFSQVSTFQTESFYRSRQFVVKPDAQPDALALAEQILDILWPTSPPEIKAKLHFRVREER